MLPALTTTNKIATKLADHARHAQGAYAPETERAVRNDTAIFLAWCTDNGRQMLPASPETMVAYIDAMSATRAPATIRRYLASIAHLHRAAGVESPTTAEIVKMALKRITKAKGARQRQAAPLTRQIVDQILDAMGERLIDLRDKALIAVAYDTLARRGELVALDIEDITLGEDSGTVLIRRGKTDQAGEGSVRFIARDTCQHLRAWIEASAAEGALFRAVRQGGAINGRIGAGDVSRIYKRRAKAAGIDPAGLSGHSSRVGAAQDLVAADLGIAEVMQAGGWKTPTMVARYTEHLQARRGAMSKLAARQGRT